MKGSEVIEKLTKTVKEMGQHLGISAGKAYEPVKTEGFTAIRIGRKLVSKEGLIRWVENETGNHKSFKVKGRYKHE